MTDIRELLARNIKEYRRICGFSQEVLAEKAGTSTTHIGMIEIGKSFPSTEMLTRIAEALGIDTPELFTTEQVKIMPHNNKSFERMYQDIMDDFQQFEKTVAAKIRELQQHG